MLRLRDARTDGERVGDTGLTMDEWSWRSFGDDGGGCDCYCDGAGCGYYYLNGGVNWPS